MRCNRQGIALTGAVAAIGVLAACSSGTAATSASPPPATDAATPAAAASTTPATPPPAPGTANSCTVISQAQAGAALGQSVQPPIMGHAFVEGGRACVFDGPSAPPGADPDIPYADTVRVVLVTGPKAKKYFDDYKAHVNAQPLSGLGDAAFYDGFASVSVLKGDAYVRIAVGIADNLSAEKTLAADALPRM